MTLAYIEKAGKINSNKKKKGKHNVSEREKDRVHMSIKPWYVILISLLNPHFHFKQVIMCHVSSLAEG